MDMKQLATLMNLVIEEKITLQDIPGFDALAQAKKKYVAKQIEVEKHLNTLWVFIQELELESEDDSTLNAMEELMNEYAWETGQEYDDGEFWESSSC